MVNTRTWDRRRTPKKDGPLSSKRKRWLGRSILGLTAVLVVAGHYHFPLDASEYEQGPAPLRMPSPAKKAGACCSYEDSLTGGKIFTMYCSYCHSAPSLAERNFANYRNVAAHMRVRANLTGKEYAKLLDWMRRWHDVPPPTPPVLPSPKRFFFSQPIQELRPKTPGKEPLPGGQPGSDQPVLPDVAPQPRPLPALEAPGKDPSKAPALP